MVKSYPPAAELGDERGDGDGGGGGAGGLRLQDGDWPGPHTPQTGHGMHPKYLLACVVNNEVFQKNP